MWNNYWSGRSRRDVPQVDYNESSEEEEEFDSPLVSPQRPPPTRAGSPVQLAIPTLSDNVDEELESVAQTLSNVGHSHTFRNTRPVIPRPDPEGGENPAQEVHPLEPEVINEDSVTCGASNDPEDIVVNEDFVTGGAEGGELENDNEGNQVEDEEPPVIMVFETENGVDSADALEKSINRAERIQWDDDDLLFFFQQFEIKLAAVGAKNSSPNSKLWSQSCRKKS